MIRLTLPDGTRTQLEASEITDVEAVAGGSLVHRAAAEPMMVMQDARIILTRINAELDAPAAESDDVSVMAIETHGAITPVEPALMEKLPRGSLAEPPTRLRRLKLLMEGRVSVMALAIAQTHTQTI